MEKCLGLAQKIAEKPTEPLDPKTLEKVNRLLKNRGQKQAGTTNRLLNDLARPNSFSPFNDPDQLSNDLLTNGSPQGSNAAYNIAHREVRARFRRGELDKDF